MSQTYKDFVRALASVDTMTAEELENNIANIVEKVPNESIKDMLDNIKSLTEEIEDDLKDKETLNEGEGTKKSIKELIGEIFPSLSFYPALGIWGLIDKIIQSDKGFDVLTEEQGRLLAVYTAIFFGLVGGKIAYNRLKERLVTNEKNDEQINEVLRLAGIQLNEDEIDSYYVTRKYKVTDIDWDEADKEDLPKTLEVEIEVKRGEDQYCNAVENEIAEEITELTGYCVNLFHYEEIEEIEDTPKIGDNDGEELDEGTVKTKNGWTNKGKCGTHGKFKTKKAADSQRKAMFANGYKG